MKLKLRKIFAAVAAMTMMLVLTACNGDKYEHLKTDIVGVWCDVEGPEYIVDQGDPYYRMYEFTADGQMIYHNPSETLGSVYYEGGEYQINDNYFSSGGQMCIIKIENGILTMTHNGGDDQYRKMSIEEVTEYGVYYIDETNYKAQIDYIAASKAEETSAAETTAATEATQAAAE